jgi:hypothetical protein
MSTLKTDNFEELATGDSVGAKYVVHGTAKAWANLNGTGTIALRDSFNVSSVVDSGTGEYLFNLSNAMLNTNYATFFDGGKSGSSFGLTIEATLTVGSALAYTFSSAFVAQDTSALRMSINGDLA